MENVVDLDCGYYDYRTAHFDGTFDNYLKQAQEISDTGKVVLLCGYRNFREFLLSKNVKYTALLPDYLDKSEYKKRLLERENASERHAFIIGRDWHINCVPLVGECVCEMARGAYISDYLDDFRKLNLK